MSENTTSSSQPLGGLRVQFSISDSPDLAALGLAQEHVASTLREIARSVLLRGGAVGYAGDLRRSGFTEVLADLVARYREQTPQDKDAALTWFAMEGVNRGSEEDYRRFLSRWRGMVKCDPVESEATDKAERLTALRDHVAAWSNALVALGGQPQTSGKVPGVAEEIRTQIRKGHRVLLIPSFGGAVYDSAAALGVSLPTHFAVEDSRDLTDMFADVRLQAEDMVLANALAGESRLGVIVSTVTAALARVSG